MGIFFGFLIVVGVENQLHRRGQTEAYRNDAYSQQLRETIREHQRFRQPLGRPAKRNSACQKGKKML